jgi:hypothetical protein
MHRLHTFRLENSESAGVHRDTLTPDVHRYVHHATRWILSEKRQSDARVYVVHVENLPDLNSVKAAAPEHQDASAVARAAAEEAMEELMAVRDARMATAAKCSDARAVTLVAAGDNRPMAFWRPGTGEGGQGILARPA